MFVEKKDIVRLITDCKLCVVLRKPCTKATKKKHYSQLVILFSFTKQNNQKLYLTLTSSTHLPYRSRLGRFFFFNGSQNKWPTTATGSVNRKNNPRDIKQTNQNFLLVCTAHLRLSPAHSRLAPTSVYTIFG